MDTDYTQHDHGSALAEAELKMERHLDMIQSSDGLIDQLRRNTDFSEALMQMVCWAMEGHSTCRTKKILDLADMLRREARRGV
jgi:hypothetical protein